MIPAGLPLHVPYGVVVSLATGLLGATAVVRLAQRTDLPPDLSILLVARVTVIHPGMTGLRWAGRKERGGTRPFTILTKRGAEAGSRTLTPLRAAEFKSAASAIPPLRPSQSSPTLRSPTAMG